MASSPDAMPFYPPDSSPCLSGSSTPDSLDSLALNSEAASSATSLDTLDLPRHQPCRKARLDYVRSIVQREADALQAVADRLHLAQDGFDEALDAIARLPPHAKVALTGIGKSFLVGKKAAATFCSLGIPATTIDPVQALHGDIGLLAPCDLVLFLSYSGATQELLHFLPLVRVRCTKVIALTAKPDSPLASASDVWIDGSVQDGQEADPALPAPTSSSLVALSLLHALALGASRLRLGWDCHAAERAMAFLKHHPAGSIGQYLSALSTPANATPEADA